MRNLIVCLDGTWNTPDQKDRGHQAPSNVVKMARAIKVGLVDQSLRQLLYYDTGVGTQGRKDKLIGGLTGKGITLNIQQAYTWLVENYQPEDKIFLFGFSRGAYTVRSLAGLMGLCGLPTPADTGEETEALICKAIKIYQTPDLDKRDQLAQAFTSGDSFRAGPVHFIGVWDTVGALGVPINPVKRWFKKLTPFHDVTLGRHISHAYHAVAINERRGPFAPTLWKPETLADNQTLVQAWFPGVHSNVGGGYLDSGLSDRAFLWMMGNARQHGLKEDENYLQRRINPNWFGEIRKTDTWTYKLMFWDRPKDRQIGAAHMQSERLHMSSLKRWGHESAPDDPPQNFVQVKDKVELADPATWEEEFNGP